MATLPSAIPTDLVGVGTATKKSGLSRQTLYTRLRRGELRGYRVGSSAIKVSMAEIAALVTVYEPPASKAG